MSVVDILIDNNDRNNGNWGLVFNGQTYKIAPVYDNGNAFSNKSSDEQIRQHMESERLEKDILSAAVTAYEADGHILSSQKFVSKAYPGLKEAIRRLVPQVEMHLQDIYSLIDDVPESYQGIQVCSKIRKEFYKLGIQIRFNEILKAAYKKWF